MEDRILGVEKAIIKMTVIQENQMNQSEKIFNSLNELAELHIITLKNEKDILGIGIRLDKIANNIYEKEADMVSCIATNKEELTKLGQNRMWKSISVVIAVLAFAFGYLYTDVKDVVEKTSNNLVMETKVIMDLDYIKSNVKEIKKEIKKYHNVNKAN